MQYSKDTKKKTSRLSILQKNSQDSDFVLFISKSRGMGKKSCCFAPSVKFQVRMHKWVRSILPCASMPSTSAHYNLLAMGFFSVDNNFKISIPCIGKQLQIINFNLLPCLLLLPTKICRQWDSLHWIIISKFQFLALVNSRQVSILICYPFFYFCPLQSTGNGIICIGSALRLSYRVSIETRGLETFHSIEEYRVSNLQYPVS